MGFGRVTTVAVSTPFDNSTDGWVANNVQAAIEEAPFHLKTGEVSYTSTATTTSSTDALMTGMTDTPTVAGTYLAWFSCDLNSATAGAVVSVSIYVGGVQKTDSLRKIMPFTGGTLTTGSQRVGVSTQGQMVVNGSQAVEIRWSTSSGTITAAARTMNWLRIL